MVIIHKNHYVPIWYQRRFLPSGQDHLFYLDLDPEKKTLPDGRIITMNNLNRWGPKKCFREEDLYTTMFFGIPNDDIERYLFGVIDDKGSRALRALVDQDLNKLYHLFEIFFQYLDAQKLRTPKGLDWLKSHYRGLSQLDLMHEMQILRQMHCTMWVEAVREIVSAEDSDIKFIVSDHPVTIFNYACPPNSAQCRYPNDPAITLKASQTLFPLDMNQCLILTNLEYAREPNSTDPLMERTHARYFGQTITRFDSMICTRKLCEGDIAAINFVLKARTRRFIAAAEKDWLYPETVIQSPWQELGKVLLPPPNELWHFGGEIYVGGKDGKLAHYQDEFGRSLGEAAVLKKEVQTREIGRNDPCHCGSGRKYKKCCLNRTPSERPSATEYSIRERNVILYRAVTEILGLSKGKTWQDVRREISDEQVMEIHKIVRGLWPPETNLMNLLPHPDPAILRALYAGIIDPRVILQNVTGFSLYFDEIIVLSPFTNPGCVKEEYSPTHSPSQYKQETLKNVLLLIYLAPFIEAGIVQMIPDPCDFDYHLRKQTWDMAKDRLQNWKPGEKDSETLRILQKDDFMRRVWSLPEESLKLKIRKDLPQISNEEMAGMLEYIKELRDRDPLAILQPFEPGEKGKQLLISHLRPNLELGLFLSQATGAFIYTDNRHRWGELLGATIEGSTPGKGGWERVAESLSALHLTFLNQVDPRLTLAIRQSGKLGVFRKFLRRIWLNVQTDLETDRVDLLGQRLVDELVEVHAKTQSEWELIQKELQMHNEDTFGQHWATLKGRIVFKIPLAGFGLNTVYRLMLTHSRRTDYLKSLPLAAFIEYGSNGSEN